MKKLLPLLFLLQFPVLFLQAQTKPFGVIDTADLKLKSCSFEKDANAMVLFDVAEVTIDRNSTTLTRHKRIKILNENGKSEANISLTYYSGYNIENISDLNAETINLNGKVIEFSPVDKKQIFNEKKDKNHRKIIFTFPRATAGSVIEFSYKLTTNFDLDLPDWNFQEDLPVRYSEYKTYIPKDFTYKIISRVSQKYAKQTQIFKLRGKDTLGSTCAWALSNVSAYREELFATSEQDNIEGLSFSLTVANANSLFILPPKKTWKFIGNRFMTYFGGLMKEEIEDEELMKGAWLLNSENEKIGYIFNTLKKEFTWNSKNEPYTNEELEKVWAAKSGNATEINLMLYKFLRKADIKCFLLMVSTRNNGRVLTAHPDFNQFNKTVVCIRDSSTNKNFILDASDKNSTLNDCPFEILNGKGLLLDFDSKLCILIDVKKKEPVKQMVWINGDIKADGKLEGTAQITSDSYEKINKVNSYNKLSEIAYKDELKNGDNSLSINQLTRENVEKDSLPLIESLNFKADLKGSDESYIYFNPNLFTGFYTNPFLSETRFSTIDFGCLYSYNITGKYKIPAGYKIEAIPQSISLFMPDKSINIKRITGQQDGEIIVRYLIDYRKSIFGPDEYKNIREFYKKMFEMLNEPVVLKKYNRLTTP